MHRRNRVEIQSFYFYIGPCLELRLTVLALIRVSGECVAEDQQPPER